MTDKMSCRESVTYENHAVSDDHLCTNIKTAYCITRTRTREKIRDKKGGYLWVQKLPNAGMGLSGFGGLLSEDCFGRLLFANRLMTLSHGAALEALFIFPFVISVDFAFFPLVEGIPTLDSPTDI